MKCSRVGATLVMVGGIASLLVACVDTSPHSATLTASAQQGTSAPVTTADAEVETEGPTPTEDLDLRVDGDSIPGELQGVSLMQFGRADVEVAVATLEGGEILLAEGPSNDLGLRFPGFVSDGTYPRAVVSVTPAGSADLLTPGGADFSFGIDFWVDPVSAGRELDNGDNMLQRGLASDPSQLKLELDGGSPLCRVAGSSGAVEVKWDGMVAPERWYRAECTRQGKVVTLTLAGYEQGLAVPVGAETGQGETGNLSWVNPETPISIGGKLAANGRLIQSATDQFNGKLARPVLDVEHSPELRL